jgi:hypothetical protein
MVEHVAPYQELRNAYWQYLTEFKDNHGYLNRSHTYDNFLKLLARDNIVLDDSTANIWNWYF